VKKFYIGVRSCECDIELDVYMGSSTDTEFQFKVKHSPELFEKHILYSFDTRVDAEYAESMLHKIFNVASNEQFYNKSNHTQTGFNTQGTKLLSHTKMAPAKIAATGESIGLVSTKDPRWCTGEVVGVHKGIVRSKPSRISAVDKDGKIFKKLNLDDPRIISGELTVLHKRYVVSKKLKGTGTAIDSNGNLLGRIDLNDPRWGTGEIHGPNKGKVVARDVTGKSIGRVDKSDIRFVNNELIPAVCTNFSIIMKDGAKKIVQNKYLMNFYPYDILESL
jgi:hypothetical protein